VKSNMNPYDKSPVRREEDFYGYKNQRELMEKQIDVGSEFLIVKGPPSTGKTSFLFITEKFAEKNNKIPCKIKIGDNPTSYSFFNNMFKSILRELNKKINNAVTKEYMRIYQHIVRNGNLPEEVGEFNLEFPFNYHAWNQNGRSMDDFPEYDSIYEDIENIISKTKLREDNKRIILLIDDFQKLFGIDEFGEDVSATSSTLQIGAGDNITEIFRNLWDDGCCEYFQICIATYPELIESEDNKQVKFAKRCCQIIDVDKFNNSDEMYELFERPLEKVQDHWWYKIFVKNDKSFIKEAATKYFKEYNQSLSEQYFEGKYPQNEISNILFFDIDKLEKEKRIDEFIEKINNLKRTLIEKIYDESGRRPFYAKLQLKAVFDYFNNIQPPKDVRAEFNINKENLFSNSLIDLDIENNKWIKIYQEVCGSLQKTKLIELYDKYNIERRYHLELFLQYKRFTFDEIVEMRNWDYSCYSLKKQLWEGTRSIMNEDNPMTEENFTLDLNKYDRTYFGQYSRDIAEINIPKLQSSMGRLKKDGIIEYNKADSIKYIYRPTVYEENYMRYNFMSLAIRKQIGIDYDRESKEEIMVLSFMTNFYTSVTSFYLENKPVDQKVQEIVEIIGTANIKYLDDDDEGILRSILMTKDLTFYFLEEVNILFLCSNIHRISSKDGGFLVERLINEVQIMQPFNLNKIDKSLTIGRKEKYELALKLLDKNRFVDLANNFFHTFTMIDYWQLGEIDRALEIQTNEVDYYIESGKSAHLINTELSNLIYLSLCRSNKKTAKNAYDKYKDYIEQYLKKDEFKNLIMYNYLLLTIFLDHKDSIKKLKELKKLFQDDEEAYTLVYFSSKDEISETTEYNLNTATDISLGYLL